METRSSSISMCEQDGSGREILLQGLPTADVVALDIAGGKMYWTDQEGGDIRRANLDGSGQETLLGGLANPPLMTLDIRGAPIPEPGTLLLLSVGTFGLAGCAWLRARRGA